MTEIYLFIHVDKNSPKNMSITDDVNISYIIVQIRGENPIFFLNLWLSLEPTAQRDLRIIWGIPHCLPNLWDPA